MNHVVVLLSTYNGERFLEEQLESIVAQKGVKPTIIVRDDGSTDRTREILDKWQEGGRLRWYNGPNMGPARSFLNLLRDSDDADYYAFSDQDDYWLPEKLDVATSKLAPYGDEPALYFSQTQLVDKDLKEIDSVIIDPLLTLGESLVYQFIGGCTMVMNRRLRDIINRYTPLYVTMHDVWVYEVAQAINAHIVFDRVPYILYRQHGDNVLGQTTSHAAHWKDRTGRAIRRDWHARSRLAQEVYDGYQEIMTEENIRTVRDFIESKKALRKRLRLLKDERYRCADRATYRYFRLAVLLNIF